MTAGPQGNPPTADWPKFAAWLRRWMDAEGLEVNAVADASGVSASMIHTFRRGVPTAAQQARGQRDLAPSFDMIIRLAYGLGLQLSYVLSKAGLSDAGDRWANFAPAERETLATALFAIRLYPPGKEGRQAMDLPRLANSPDDLDDLLEAVTPDHTGG